MSPTTGVMVAEGGTGNPKEAGLTSSEQFTLISAVLQVRLGINLSSIKIYPQQVIPEHICLTCTLSFFLSVNNSPSYQE